MKVSQHFENLHKTAAAHWENHAADHDGFEASNRKMSKLHRELHKASHMSDEKTSPHAQLADEFEKKADLHKAHAERSREHAEFHRSQMAECQKAVSDSLDKIAPDGVRGIITHFPNITAVPRTGQRQIEKSEVPLELEKVLSMDLE